jgi:hypothetical protein
MIQSTEEHQEIPKEHATVMLVKGQRKRHKVCNLAVEHRQKMRERIQEEVGCCLQKGVPPCKSGMVKKETFKEDSDPRKLWITERIGHCTQRDNPPCKSGMVQGTRFQEIQPGQCSTCKDGRPGLDVGKAQNAAMA